MKLIDRKRRLVLLVSAILVVGFLTTSLVSYFVTLSSLREEITFNSLPLTSDTVYSEIQHDLILPIHISSMMANDTFLRDWVIEGEEDEEEMTKYLNEIMTRYGTFTSFFVSEDTRTYYHADGVLKQVDSSEPRDEWYFRVRDMTEDYETNVDPDLANRDAMTVFINHKVYDYAGNYIGAIGVGLTVNSLSILMNDISERYGQEVYLVSPAGDIVLGSTGRSDAGDQNIRDLDGIATIADDVLAAESGSFEYTRQGKTVYLNSRLVSELGWYLLVEQDQGTATGRAVNALIANLVFCAVITAIVVAITTAAINVYERVNQRQHAELVDEHERLEQALTQVRQLSGLLPICASCKKIRDEKGEWHPLETYIRDHSDADFSHGICPDCGQALYGDLFEEPGT